MAWCPLIAKTYHYILPLKDIISLDNTQQAWLQGISFLWLLVTNIVSTPSKSHVELHLMLLSLGHGHGCLTNKHSINSSLPQDRSSSFEHVLLCIYHGYL